MLKSKKIHFAWFVAFGLLMIQSAVFGILVNCAGIAFSAIISDLGFKAGDLSIYYTVRSIATALTISFSMKLFFKYNSRIVMAYFGLLSAISFGGMYFFTQLWQWYLAAILAGTAMGSLIICIPIVISNWFNKYTGLIMGIVLSSSGLVGAIYSPIFARLIEAYGWRMASFITGVLIFVMGVIPSLLYIVSSPEKINKQAYGEKTEVVAQIKSQIKKVPTKSIFIMCVLVPLFMGTISLFANQIPTYAHSIGFSATVGASLTSFAMIGNVLSKMLFGVAYDKVGIFTSLKGAVLITGISIVMFLIFDIKAPLSVAAVLFGAVYSITLIATPLLIKDVYSQELYKVTLGKVQTINNFCVAFLGLLIPYIYDFTGSFNLFFIIAIGLSIITLLSVYKIEKYHSKCNLE